MKKIQLNNQIEKDEFKDYLKILSLSYEKNIFSDMEDPTIVVTAYSFRGIWDYSRRTASDRYVCGYYKITFELKSSMIDETTNLKKQLGFLIEASDEIQNKFKLKIEYDTFSRNSYEYIKNGLEELCLTEQEKKNIPNIITIYNPY